jgi:hypothetical protein
MQGAALENNDPTAFQHPIDFSQLASRRSSSTVPRTGVQVRVLASRASHGEGIDDGLHPIGNLEPYTLDIPSSYRPGHRLPFMLALHSLGDHYWQFTGSQGQSDWANTHKFIVATPEGRGPDTSYVDEAEYDVFEVWNDVARQFDLDPTRTVGSGYSMGGVGTQWLASLYPDLFGKAYEVVGGPYTTAWVGPIREDSSWRGDMMLWIENMRHVPVLDVYGGEDEFGGAAVQASQNLAPGMPVAPAGLDRLGYRYIGVTYPASEHLTFAGAGYMIPASDPFLDNPVVERDPAHVSFSYLPVTDDSALGLVHNHAYWVSGVKLAHGGTAPITGDQVSQADGGFTDDTGTAAKASIDAVSAAFGVGDPSTSHGATAGVGPLVLPYAEYSQTWNATPAAPRSNSLSLTLTNVAESTYDVAAAHLNVSAPMTVAVQTTTATILHLDHAFPAWVKVRVDGKATPFRRSAGQLTISLPAGSHKVVVDGGHR